MTRTSHWLALGCALALTACSHGNASTETAPSEAPGAANETPAALPKVETARIRATTFARTISAYGTVAGGANDAAALAFPEAGRIARIAVDVGDRVAHGDVLARLDSAPFDADVAQARANLQAARANLEKTNLAARPEAIVSTNAQLAQAKTQLAIANAQYERQTRLVALGVSARTELESAKASVASARAQERVFEEQLATQRHPWQPDVDASNAAVAQAQAALTAANGRRERAVLVAPFDAIVTARVHSDGEAVDANAPVVQIASAHPPAFTAQFSPDDATQVRLGADASIVLQGSNARARGVVVARDVAQSSSRSVPIVIRLAAPSSQFGPGAYGTARIVVGSRSGLVVPAVSIVADAATGATQIFRKEGDRYEPVPVEVIDRQGDRALVRGIGLRDGQTIAAQGADELVVPQQAVHKDSD